MRYRCPPCTVCKKRSVINVDGVALRRWHEGALIQQAFPASSAEVRELMVSGTHADCWQQLYGDEP